MTTERYPSLLSDTVPELARAYRQITRLRDDDVSDFNNLANALVRVGLKKSAKIPTNSNDTTGDTYGDFNYDMLYYYIVVNDTGNPKWRRIALSTF